MTVSTTYPSVRNFILFSYRKKALKEITGYKLHFDEIKIIHQLSSLIKETTILINAEHFTNIPFS